MEVMHGTVGVCASFIYMMFTARRLAVGGLAQMVERSLSMREVPGSIPGFSTMGYFFFLVFSSYSTSLPKPLIFGWLKVRKMTSLYFTPNK